MRIDILTLFPDVFEPFLSSGVCGRAIESGVVSIKCLNFRLFAKNKHRSVDDKPFGGGPGMLLMCGPVFDAVEFLDQQEGPRGFRILLTPQGRRLDQPLVKELTRKSRLIIICGHYEGVDERIRVGLNPLDISIGDYVLSGGEPAAMVLIDALVRLLPGAIGNERSPDEESFSSGLLEYPQYTRPRSFQGMKVPEVLLSGDHEAIKTWREKQALAQTRTRRPDLLEGDKGVKA